MYDVRGSDPLARPATKSATRCAGADLMLPAPLPRRLFEPLLEFQPRQLAPFGTQMFEIRKPDLRDQPRIGIGRRTAAGRPCR